MNKLIIRLLTSVRLRLANDAEHPDELRQIALANEFTQLQQDWVQIAPYGDFPHAGHGRGTKYLQRIDRRAASDVVSTFEELKRKKGAQFAGVPWYIGHPDVPELANEYPDQRAYGWVMDLQAREDGLYGQVKWSEPGKVLIANAHFKYYSPYFGLTAGGKHEDRVIAKPVHLVSVGFTNTPNIPVSLLANTRGGELTAEGQQQEPNNHMKEQLIKWLAGLGITLANDAKDEAVTDALKQISEKVTNGINLANAAKTDADKLKAEQDAHASTRKQLEAERDGVKTQLANERKSRIDLLLDNAVADGRITGAQRPVWATDLAGNFDAKVIELANVKPTTKTTATTANLGARKGESTDETPGQTAVRLANAHIRETKCSWDEAWKHVQGTRADLFESMKKPVHLANAGN